MNDTLKLLGIITLVVVIGFSMAACGGDGNSENDNNNGNGDGNGNNNGNNNAITYAVTVTNGTGSGNYAQGETVTITANTPPAGQQFKEWTTASEGVTFANAASSNTTFTMPANAVTVTANFESSFVPEYAVGGTGPGGGIIYYISPTGFTVQGYGSPGDSGYFAEYTAHYLEAAPVDQATYAEWGDSGTSVTGITTIIRPVPSYYGSSYIGVGRKDTQTIVAHMNSKSISGTAAQLCDDYSNNGLSDWFLPSSAELRLLYINHHIISITYFDLSHWSSSQDNDEDIAFGIFLYDGSGHFHLKWETASVRAVRAF
jgi:hypothetical protein